MKIIQRPKLINPAAIHGLPATATRLLDIGCWVGEMANAFHVRGASEYYLRVTLHKSTYFNQIHGLNWLIMIWGYLSIFLIIFNINGRV